MADFWSTTNPKNPGLPTGIKIAGSQLDFPLDWTDWLKDSDDSIAPASIRVLVSAPLNDPSPIEVEKTELDGGEVVPFLKGGTVGSVYGITCLIETNSVPLRRDSRTVYIEVVAKRST